MSGLSLCPFRRQYLLIFIFAVALAREPAIAQTVQTTSTMAATAAGNASPEPSKLIGATVVSGNGEPIGVVEGVAPTARPARKTW
jgi:hypothetical protein